VQVLDGRNGKTLANQHVLVFTGLSANAVKTYAQHAWVTTDKDGMGTLAIYPGEAQCSRSSRMIASPCFPSPNQDNFSVIDIMSKGLVTPNDCSTEVRHLLICYARSTWS
jgi:hypothetical protein